MKYSYVLSNINYGNVYYSIYENSYTKNLMRYVQLTPEEYKKLQEYQDANQIQIIYPMVKYYSIKYKNKVKSLYKNYPNVC